MSGDGADLPVRTPRQGRTGVPTITVGSPAAADLPAINAVLEAALMGWRLPERVKRLALPSYRYTETDLDQLAFAVARDDRGALIAFAAWEPAGPGEGPPGKTAMLLHGLYVDPRHQRSGIGARLLGAAGQATAASGADGLLVKAQRDAEGFFTALGLVRLDTTDSARDYARRFWRGA